VFTSPEQLDLILGNDLVHGVSFTGSTNAGKSIAAVAGKHLKRSVMELGGSDPFMVMKSAKVSRLNLKYWCLGGSGD
jgi:succinate-semialdehyde dehydrogenase/glutarate-semialdehyde dehydrogenase